MPNPSSPTTALRLEAETGREPFDFLHSDVTAALESARAPFTRIAHAIRDRVVGQTETIDRVLTALLAGGHVLLEGPPGLAKTLLVRTLADALGSESRRIQFTPDLLPSDILGTVVQRPDGEFGAWRGPIFAPLVVADEINRAPAKVQAALLEAMEERQVTLGGETIPLPDPFFVMATQNPLEQRGTYALAEAQLDRFMMRIRIGYPAPHEEVEILRRSRDGGLGPIGRVAGLGDVCAARAALARVRLDDRVLAYVVAVVRGTRELGGEDVEHGASPRAGIALASAARARAFLRGRSAVVPSDVKDLAHDVLAHRLCLSPAALARDVTAHRVLDRVLASVAVP